MKIDDTIQELPQIAGMNLANISSKTLLFYTDIEIDHTALSKELTKEPGALNPLSSPTFSIVNEYLLDSDSLVHFDFYRITSGKDGYYFGTEEQLEPSHWNLIQYSEKLEIILPLENKQIQLTKNQNGSRTIKLAPVN